MGAQRAYHAGIVLAVVMLASRLWGVTPSEGEFERCRRWSERTFGATGASTETACLKVLYEDVAEGVTRGRSWRGTPCALGDKTYTHGIAFNSTKHILVRLGKPAERFVAEVGLENNDDTRRGAAMGNGSVTFHVRLAGKEVFASPVMRLQDGAMPLDVNLQGAREFEIRVGDAGDGRGWNQALWAEATVFLENGTSVRLQDLPRAEDAGYNPFGLSFLYDGKPSASLLRESGRELLLWFEPERVYKDTPWYRQHRDWLFDQGGDSCLLNLGNPEARRFLTDFISARIAEFGLGCYRQDFNIDPLAFWKAADPLDRQGISEIRHIEGLYAFWDELLRHHPRLIIDNCASGGRRIDLETIGRATPFWRTDGPRDPIAHQCHTYGLLSWVPLNSTSQDRAGDDYEFRSSMSSGLCLNWWGSGDRPTENIPEDFPFDWAHRTLEQYLSLRRFFYGDFYPLTAYSQAGDVWMAYQLDRPDIGEGLVVILKRPESPSRSARLALKGLREGATYEVRNLDTGDRKTCSGGELARDGLDVLLDAAPDSALFTYRR